MEAGEAGLSQGQGVGEAGGEERKPDPGPPADGAPRGRRTLNKEENTWKVYTAQEPSESPMSCVTWLCQASSASSQAAGWNAARMAEKKGEGGGETPLSPSPKLEGRGGGERAVSRGPRSAPVPRRPPLRGLGTWLWRLSLGRRALPDCAERGPALLAAAPHAALSVLSVFHHENLEQKF